MPRKLTRRRPSFEVSEEMPLLAQLWLSRLLIGLSGHRHLINSSCVTDDAIGKVVSLGKWLDTSRRQFDDRRALAELRAWGRTIERKARMLQRTKSFEGER